MRKLILLWLLACPILLQARYIRDEGLDDGDSEEFALEYQQAFQQLRKSGLVFNWPSADVLDGLGAVSGVAIGPNEDVYLLQRGGRVWASNTFNAKNEYNGDRSKPIPEETILVFSHNLNRSGLLDAFASNMMFMPHGLSVDTEGNVWVTDVALHQVMKFPKGKNEPSLVLGERFKPGNDLQHFCKPTDVAVAKNGDYFIADGYCNSRILMFDKKNRLITMWGKPDNDDGVLDSDELSIPHSLILLEDRDELCVADREHARVQCYHAGIKDPKRTGNFTASVDVRDLGAPYALAYNKPRGLIGVLGGAREPAVWRSDVGFYDAATKRFAHKFAFPGDEGFGDGHDLDFGPRGDRALVGSLTKVCPAISKKMCDDPMISRNVWLFL